jgi:hypothetical protein
MTTKRRKPAPKAHRKPAAPQSLKARVGRIERRLDRLERKDRRITGFERCEADLIPLEDDES